LTWNIYIADVL